MTDEIITNIGEMDLPFSRRANLKNVEFESGMNMLRLTLREGRRFTILDLDAVSAAKLGILMVKWADVSGNAAQTTKAE
ncbi:MAG: hypothetical protein V3V25_11850 [Paracoccaceae bacterium]